MSPILEWFGGSGSCAHTQIVNTNIEACPTQENFPGWERASVAPKCPLFHILQPLLFSLSYQKVTQRQCLSETWEISCTTYNTFPKIMAVMK